MKKTFLLTLLLTLCGMATAWAGTEGIIDCPTAATAQNGKMHFSSKKITYEGNCNKLRFTLTESGAYYKNGAKRMSFDSFVLYKSNGEAVALEDKNFTGNNITSFAAMLDGANGTYSNAAWDASAATDDWFEVTLPNGVDLGGAFSFSFVTENTTMNAKAFKIELSYVEVEAPVVYSLVVDAPEGQEVTVQYDGEAVADGTIEGEVMAYLFTASAIPGYVWSVDIDEENRVVAVTYTEIVPEVNPAAVVALVNRIGGEGTASKFKFVLDLSINQEQETFVLGSEGKKILIKGSTLSALTTGLGWYLNNVAHVNIAWNALNEKTVAVKERGAAYVDFSNITLPLPAEETHTSDAKYRYYLNTCAFGYSMTSWTWTRWQQEIDWMALHGINMPLQLVGLEEVWRTFLTMEDGSGKRKYGYTDEEAKAFVAGPAFIAWWAMNNLEGWGGTAPGTKSGYNNLAGAGGVQDDAWYVRQRSLARQIVEAQRALGMQPVIPGWSGMVPTNFQSRSGFATRGNGGKWAGDFVRPLLLNVNIGADKYAEIAADYYACLHAVMGESQYYSMDPFHEGGGAGTMEDYEALYAAMEAAQPGSQWVIQQWQWSATQKYSLTAVPAGRLIVLDLFSDGSPAFDGYNGYAPQDGVFCAIPNFGGRSGLMGRLQNVTDNYFKFKNKYASIKGIGTAPEAIEQTPVTYDLIYQLPWMNGVKPDVAKWVENYAVARYGKDNKVVKEAWSLLRQGPLAYGADGIQGPVEDVWAARPNLDANRASSWGKTLKDAGHIYTPARRQMLFDAVYKLLAQEKALKLKEGSVYESNYLYDLVEFGGGVMADYAYDLLLGIRDARNAGNTALYEARRDAFLQLILDMDAFKGTNLNFRLGKWTQEARDAAGEVVGATTATPDWYEYNNARTIVSTWSSPGTNLNDYSYRSWQGLLKDLYYPRWKHFFDNNCTNAEYKFFEWNWAHGMTHRVGDSGISTTPLQKGEVGHTDSYTREPEGNTVAMATELLGKYIIPVAMADGTHYAYRYLTNDLTTKVTIVAKAGDNIDLTRYFVGLDGATVTGDFIDGTAANLTKVAVKKNVADGAYTGTLTLADGTVLTFAVVINPKYYGVYKIDYKNGSADAPVFIGYNEDRDNSGNVGYKLMATGTYSADAEADKLFTITPCGTGYSFSAQGKYLKSPTLGGWNHIMFSDDKSEAGAYLFEETSTASLFMIRSTGNGINYVNDYDKGVFGNDKSDKENLSTFSLTEVTNYAFTMPSGGIATLCLPFHVVLPEGMEAYDVAMENVSVGTNNDEYLCAMQLVASAGEVLRAATPVVVKAVEGEHQLAITMEGAGAVTGLPGSLLQGNMLKGALEPIEAEKTFMLTMEEDAAAFRVVEEACALPANQARVVCDATASMAAARVLRLDFDAATSVEPLAPATEVQAIYSITGVRLEAPQKGINIINNKKVIIK